MRTEWWVGVVAAVGVVIGGRAGAVPSFDPPRNDANLTVTQDGSTLSCPQAEACWDVHSEKNITHIFINVDFSECVDPPFAVTVNDEPIEKFHFNGGPCNHGDRLIERVAWFPLPANQFDARVCITTPGAVPNLMNVGAKSSDECVSGDPVDAECQICGEPACPNDT